MGGLIQASNMSKQISINGGATIKASRKTAHDKVFFILGQKAPWKKIIALNLYWYQCFSVWKNVDSESLVHDKGFVLKKHFLQK